MQLLLNITAWLILGLGIGVGSHDVIGRRRRRHDSTDRPYAMILGILGAGIGGAVVWSMHGAAPPMLAALCTASFGAILLCSLQIVTPL